jgi:TrmH family RNA methyltransferase
MEMIDFSKIILLKILQNIKKYYIIKYESNYKKEGIMIIDIVSASNAKYKYIKSLKEKKFRTKNKEYTVEGIKSVHDAIASQREISMIAVSEDFFENENFDYPQDIPLYRINTSIFNKLCDTQSPQGIIAVIKMEDIKNFKPEKDKAYVYCDGINDPGNLGTIIRTADAAGFGGVLLSKGTVDLYNPKTVRASMGSFFNIKVITDAGIDDLKRYKEDGFILFGGALGDNTIDYKNADMTQPSFIVVGNEANGISDQVQKICQCVKIPILGKAESLNAAVAAGILMYELVSQRMGRN